VKRQQVFVRAESPSGKWGNHDVLDLEDDSFKAFVIDRLMKAGVVTSIKSEFLDGDDIEYKSKVEEI
jgi:hypothetical protein